MSCLTPTSRNRSVDLTRRRDMPAVDRLDDLTADELTLLADNAEHYASAFTRIENEEAATHFRERARRFKELAAAESHAQEVFETTGAIDYKREIVTLPEVESTLRE